MDLNSHRCWARSLQTLSKANPTRCWKNFAGARRYAREKPKKLRVLLQICSGGLRPSNNAPLTERRYITSARPAVARLPFVRGFFFSLTLEQCDLFDPRGIRWAPGRHVRIVFERVMDEAPLIRIHRLELKRATSDADAIGQFSHALHDAIFAH